MDADFDDDDAKELGYSNADALNKELGLLCFRELRRGQERRSMDYARRVLVPWWQSRFPGMNISPALARKTEARYEWRKSTVPDSLGVLA